MTITDILTVLLFTSLAVINPSKLKFCVFSICQIWFSYLQWLQILTFKRQQKCLVPLPTHRTVSTLLFWGSSHSAVFTIRSAHNTEWLIGNNHSNSSDSCKWTSCRGTAEPHAQWKYCQTVISKQMKMLLRLMQSTTCAAHHVHDICKDLLRVPTPPPSPAGVFSDSYKLRESTFFKVNIVFV